MERSEDRDSIDPERHISDERQQSLSEKIITADEPEEPTPSEVQKPDVPPDGGYGWVVVAWSVFFAPSRRLEKRVLGSLLGTCSILKSQCLYMTPRLWTKTVLTYKTASR